MNSVYVRGTHDHLPFETLCERDPTNKHPDQLCTISHFYMKRIKAQVSKDEDPNETRDTYSRLVTLTVYLYCTILTIMDIVYAYCHGVIVSNTFLAVFFQSNTRLKLFKDSFGSSYQSSNNVSTSFDISIKMLPTKIQINGTENCVQKQEHAVRLYNTGTLDIHVDGDDVRLPFKSRTGSQFFCIREEDQSKTRTRSFSMPIQIRNTRTLFDDVYS